jgi:mRNA-degrading endonuclease RelE of RelBE toxin-antitoxin system
MSCPKFLKEYNALPPNYQRQVDDFVLFLKAKIAETQSRRSNARLLGRGKDSIAWIASDFDAPLDDMKEYME